MTRSPVNALFLNWKDPHGGAAGGSETMVRRCAESWAEAGHRVTVFVPRASGTAAEEVIRGVRYVRAGRLHTVFPLARRYLRRHRNEFEVVIDSVSGRPFFACDVVGDRASAVVHHVCAEQWQREYRFPISHLGRYVVEPWWLRRLRGSRVIAMSDSTVRDLDRLGLRTAAIVLPGLDAPAGAGPRRTEPRSEPRLLFIGRLIRAKRPFDSVAAFRRVREVFPGAQLDIAGHGYMTAELKALCEPGVRFHGFVSDAEKHRLLSDADVLLMPATREGWGLVNVEAAAHGVPVVGYDVAGVRDAVVDGKTGVLTESTPEALAAAAVSLLGDAARWRAYSVDAATRARSFAWDLTAGRLLSDALQPRTVPHVELAGYPAAAAGVPGPGDVGLEAAVP
jgi:glycosyltransferase involved in cell wall biosynthesis